eukprot:scaffold330362_cov48-Prasinocladus_malaysianus.AAC.1
MAAAARLIWAEVKDCVSDLQSRLPRLRLVVVGHSMGAGVGALLTILFNTSALNTTSQHTQPGHQP